MDGADWYAEIQVKAIKVVVDYGELWYVQHNWSELDVDLNLNRFVA